MTKEEKIKISIIIPVYNAEQYLSDTLENVLQQSISAIEILCIDDGSTDQSLYILKNIAVESNKIKVLTQKNQGAGAARNRGIMEAKGQYIAFMDADDYYPNSGILELLYTKATESKCYIVGGSFSEYLSNYEKHNYAGIAKGYQFKEEGIISYRNYQFDYGYHRFIYNREFLLENNLLFPPYRRFQDPPFFIRTMLAAKQFYAVSEITYCYRISYKGIAWTERQVNDLLIGLLENMEIAKTNQLKKLYWITLKRIQGEYQDILLSGCYQKNKEIEKLFIQLNQLLFRDWLNTREKVFLYFDIKRIIKLAIWNCHNRLKRKPINRYVKIKKLLNGSYIDLNGFESLLQIIPQKMKSR